MKELVVISGKGGTGKTSITASFAQLAKDSVIVDCDVDAADLHLILTPEIKEKHDFYSGHEAEIDSTKCMSCGKCFELCQFDAIKKGVPYKVDQYNCEGCGVCVKFCPYDAISFEESLCGEWMVSETRFGSMVHAKLGVAAENSGKLVTTIKSKAQQIAKEENKELIIIDGSPGIGCPVIASLTGATQTLIVTEPTMSGLSDMKRILSLTKHFNIPSAVCINKADINIEITEQIENKAKELGATVAGRIRYDDEFITSQINKQTAIESNCDSSADIKNIWNFIKKEMNLS